MSSDRHKGEGERSIDEVVVDDATMRELAGLADGSRKGEERYRLLAQVEREGRLARELAAQRRALDLISSAAREPAPSALRASVARLLAEKRRRARPARRAVLGVGAAGICAGALALALVLASPGGPGPTLGQAVALTRAPAMLPTPRESGHDGMLADSVEGVSFPYYDEDDTRMGWEPKGARQDMLKGRMTHTVFYSSRSGARVGYTIVAGSAIPVRGGRVTWHDGVAYRSMQMHGSSVVTWVEKGHSCVLSGQIGARKLLALATLG